MLTVALLWCDSCIGAPSGKSRNPHHALQFACSCKLACVSAFAFTPSDRVRFEKRTAVVEAVGHVSSALTSDGFIHSWLAMFSPLGSWCTSSVVPRCHCSQWTCAFIRHSKPGFPVGGHTVGHCQHPCSRRDSSRIGVRRFCNTLTRRFAHAASAL